MIPIRPARLVVVLVFILAGCSPAEAPVYQQQFFAFGTLVDVSLYGTDVQQAEAASHEIEGIFSTLHETWHAWEHGPLRTLNEQLATGNSVAPEPDLLAVLIEANRLSLLSNGLFNPLMGRLVALWGFHGDALPIGTLPDVGSISQLVKARPNAGDVSISNQRIKSSNASASYDLGGFAKGLAIDRAITYLRANGIENAIVNAGGDLRAIGRHGDRPWRIGIRHPRSGGVMASLEISGDESVFTSGDYERFFEVNGKRYHHIIDPRSGYPAEHTISVTVLHTEAATADAAATALFVAGPDEWLSTAHDMGIRHAMLVDTQGNVYMTPDMQHRLHFEPGFSGTIQLDRIP